MTDRQVRIEVGWPQVKIAAYATVSVATVRLFELSPLAVRDGRKRMALARVYTGLRVCLGVA